MPDGDAFDTYVEPFAGGAAVFYALSNDGRLDGKTRVLGDGDADLIALYAAVQGNLTSLVHETSKYITAAQKASDPKAYYEAERELWNKGGRYRSPGRHLFLRKACWNGLWRTNKDGGMNTPWKGEAPKDLDVTKIQRAHETLQGVELLDWDFRRYEDDEDFFVGERTLVYLDPPYLGDGDDFNSYLPSGWTEDDLKYVFELCRSWSARGAHVVLSHAETPLTRALALDWAGSTVHQIEARRSINSDGAGRGPVEEVIIVGKPADVDTRHVTLHSISNHGEDARAESSAG
jgi:DNA adenine methylase Dam